MEMETPQNNPQEMTRVEKARQYHRTGRRLAVAEFLLGAAYLIWLLVSGWTFYFRHLAYQAGGGPAVWVGVYFVLAMSVFELISLPLGVYSGYVVEKRYGLLNQSAASWVWDLVKSWLVGLGLGLIAVELLYLIIRLAGSWWWLPAGLAFTLLFVVLAQLAPVLIFPIFYKFKKLEENDLTSRLTDLCSRAGTEVMGIYEWGLSEKTRKVNAALTGWGPTRRVILSDSLLAQFTPSEIEAVLAHELGHHRRHHLWLLLGLQVIVVFAAFIAADLLFRFLGPVFGLESLQDAAGMPLLGLSFTIVGLIALPLVNTVSRRLERQADQFALEMTDLAGSFVSALERLAVMNLSEMSPHPVIEFMFHGHPSPARRIAEAKSFQMRKAEGGA